MSEERPEYAAGAHRMTIHLDQLTIGQAKALAALFGGTQHADQCAAAIRARGNNAEGLV